MSLKTIYQAFVPTQVREDWAKARGHRHDLRMWRKAGKPLPPPPCVKRKAVADHARRFETKTLIETGTYLGDMIFAQKRNFQEIVSIEIDHELYLQAVGRFWKDANVRLIHGDSGTTLPIVLSHVTRPCLFWLDGHWSGPGTGRGTVDTPVSEELEAILSHSIRGHVILIDDARCFLGQDGYPTIDGVKASVASIQPRLKVSVKDDIIRVHP